MRREIIVCDRCNRDFEQGTQVMARVDVRWTDDRGDANADHIDLCHRCFGDFLSFMCNEPVKPKRYAVLDGTEVDHG